MIPCSPSLVVHVFCTVVFPRSDTINCILKNVYQTGGRIEKRRNRNKTDAHEKHGRKLTESNLLIVKIRNDDVFN